MDEGLARVAEAWAADDPDPATAAEIRGLIAAGDESAVRERFSDRLQFGTAGLRGELGAGPARMNRALVRRITAGLVAWLATRGQAGPLVVGFDARHGSRLFAEDTCAIATGAGRDAVLLPGPLPTPVLAFAVRHLGAAAGVMVTASHNPARDNGYKVYDAGGAQIVPPADDDISATIDAVARVRDLPLGPVPQPAGPEVHDAYVAAALSASLSSTRGIRVATTPMHGVGGALLHQLLAEAGFADHHVVPAQAAPDPDFPTVAFPNPEEPGALDLVLALAGEVGADVAIANDPDADRMSAAVPDPAAAGGWRPLTGDEVGAILGWWVLARTVGDDRLVATTIVSSRLLAAQAAAAGVACAEVLTGFKWLVRTPRPGQRLVYAYEEALGHAVGGADGPVVRDKDGLTAALAMCEAVASLKAEGRTPLDVLAELAARFGAHATGQVSLPTAAGAEAVDRLRHAPPTALGGRAVEEVMDLAEGYHGLPPTDGLRLALDGGGRVIIRPSGTEPKVKAYVEVVEATRLAAQAGLAAVLADVRSVLT